jgi:hypothetical protein
VNGPLMNFILFYEAFELQAGEVNYKTEEERIKIWYGKFILKKSIINPQTNRTFAPC